MWFFDGDFKLGIIVCICKSYNFVMFFYIYIFGLGVIIWMSIFFLVFFFILLFFDDVVK